MAGKTGSRNFNSRSFRTAVAGVVQRHMRGVDPDTIDNSEIAQIAADAVKEAIHAMRSDTDPVGYLIRQSSQILENTEFTRLRDLKIKVPLAGGTQTDLFRILSTDFFDEPFFQEHPTIASVRQYLAQNRQGIGDLPGNNRGGARMHIQRRQELARLVYMCGVEPLPGMLEAPPGGKAEERDRWDYENLCAFMDGTMLPLARDAIRKGLKAMAAEEDKNNYLLTDFTTTRREIISLLRITQASLGVLDNEEIIGRFGQQARAQVMFLLFPSQIIVQDNALHIVSPENVRRRFRKIFNAGIGNRQDRKAGL